MSGLRPDAFEMTPVVLPKAALRVLLDHYQGMLAYRRNHPTAYSEEVVALSALVVDIVKNAEATKVHHSAVALGRVGGKKGGPARAAALTPERRREISQQAAAKRWHKEPTR